MILYDYVSFRGSAEDLFIHLAKCGEYWGKVSLKDLMY